MNGNFNNFLSLVGNFFSGLGNMESQKKSPKIEKVTKQQETQNLSESSAPKVGEVSPEINQEQLSKLQKNNQQNPQNFMEILAGAFNGIGKKNNNVSLF
ncbi:MAG: hypothetical protein ACRC0V_05100 [Fusobacteriaceae bacterium]